MQFTHNLFHLNNKKKSMTKKFDLWSAVAFFYAFCICCRYVAQELTVIPWQLKVHTGTEIPWYSNLRQKPAGE